MSSSISEPFSNAELRGHVCVVQVEPEQDLQLRDQAGLWDGLRNLLLVHAATELYRYTGEVSPFFFLLSL